MRSVRPSTILFAVVASGIILSGLPKSCDAANGVPACFADDTVYHAILDFDRNSIHLWYGAIPLLTCPLAVPPDSGDAESFANRWRDRRTPWQSVTERTVLRGRPAVSDTVVEVVSRVVKVDPDLIRRIQPDRFAVDLTGGFRLIIHVSDSVSESRSFGEVLASIGRWVFSFGRSSTLTLTVSPENAQTLYYALEPGAPVLLNARTGD